MEFNTGEEQHSNKAGDIQNIICQSIYPIVLMIIACMVPGAYHIAIKRFSRDCTSLCLARRHIHSKATWNSSTRFNQDTCPICLSVPSLALATNCGHVFCAPCLRAMWRNAQQQAARPYIPCPMCRAKLYEIMPLNPDEVLFSPVMAPPIGGNFNNNNYVTLYDFIHQFNTYYQHVRGPQPLMRCVWKFFLGGLKGAYNLAFRTGYQNPFAGVLMCVLVPVMYVAQPNNMIGDSLGYMDDAMVVVLCTFPLVHYIKYIQQAHHV